MRRGNVIGKVGFDIENAKTVEDLAKQINYYDLIMELIERNFNPKGISYFKNIPNIENLKHMTAGMQRLTFTRIFLRSMLMVKSKIDLPHLDKIINLFNQDDTFLIWFDKVQTQIIPYCNEYKVFDTLQESRDNSVN